jgi:hypothetical protein
MSSPISIKTIEIHAFRWAGTREGNDPPDEATLKRLTLGHVGIRVIGKNIVDSENIYSFRPKKPIGMSMDDFFERIKKGESFAGQILPEGDNMLFEEAKKNCVKLIKRRRSLNKSSCLEIKKQLDIDIANSPLENKKYSLPPMNEEDKWQLNSYNCATILGTLGMESPYPSGRLKDYLKEGVYEITTYRCS